MFKVGDRVRVKADAKSRTESRNGWLNVMDDTPGREGVITLIDSDGDFDVAIPGHEINWSFSAGQLELVDPATPATPATPPQAADALTLRDQFAMAALTGLLATLAYDCADAMLAARDGKAGAQ